MSDDNNVVELPPALPKPKRTGWPKGKPRGPRGPRAKPSAAAPPPMPAEFAGLTENACCDACKAAHFDAHGKMIADAYCVISGIAICGHPFKTPVNVIIGMPKAVDRYQRARKVLAHRSIDLRGA